MYIKLKGTYISSKANEDGTTGPSSRKWIYIVSGSKEELDKYKELRGDKYRTEETTGEPLYFTTRFEGENAELGISSKGNIYVNNDELDRLNSLIERYPGTMGKYIAEVGLKQFFSKPQPEPEIRETIPNESNEL